MHIDFDVAVIGYGPTGLVAASALGAKGHRVLVIERWPGLYGLPRLSHIDGETARIVQNVGDPELAFRVARPVDSYKWMGADGGDLLTVDWSGTSSGYPAHLAIFQPDIEDAIDARTRSYPNVTVKQGWNLEHIEQDADRVTLRVRKWSRDRNQQWAGEGDVETYTALYVFAADGANSFVRESLGIERDARFRSGQAPAAPPFPTVTAGVISTDEHGAPANLGGTLAPQGRVAFGGDEGLFDTVVGSGFALVTRRDASELLTREQLVFLAELGATVASANPGATGGFADLDGEYGRFFSEHGVDAFISRPDFSLFGAVTEESLPALVEELRGKLVLRTEVGAQEAA